MVATSDTPSEYERRAQDCLAKAAYCKFTKLSVAWEKEATELKKGAAK